MCTISDKCEKFCSEVVVCMSYITVWHDQFYIFAIIFFYLISFIKFHRISKVDGSYQRKEEEIYDESSTTVANNVKNTKIDRGHRKSTAQRGNWSFTLQNPNVLSTIKIVFHTWKKSSLRRVFSNAGKSYFRWSTSNVTNWIPMDGMQKIVVYQLDYLHN